MDASEEKLVTPTLDDRLEQDADAGLFKIRRSRSKLPTAYEIFPFQRDSGLAFAGCGPDVFPCVPRSRRLDRPN